MDLGDLLLLVGLIALLLPALYFLFLTLVGLLYRPPAGDYGEPRSNFAILVPAHNEELLLPHLLTSLQELVYPLSLFKVFVVADNCSDTTAEVARIYGATVFERRDPARRGKGYALQWLLQQIRATEKDYDAYIFLDADSAVSPNFLAVMDARFQAGSAVVQSYYTVSSPFQTPVSALRFIAMVLKHYVRPKGRQVLGLSCGLFGTGMGFRRDILDTHGWYAFTLAEDIECYLNLADQGVRVHFAPEAIVCSQMPTSLPDARSQNLRWEKGRWQMAWRYGSHFFTRRLLNGKLIKFDAVLEQAIPPLSVTMLVSLVLLLLTLLVGASWLVPLGIAINSALLGHIFIGLISARVPLRAYWAFAYAPRFILWKLFIYAAALLPRRTQWVRTERHR